MLDSPILFHNVSEQFATVLVFIAQLDNTVSDSLLKCSIASVT